MGILSHLGIVGTKSWSDVNDTSTILCCDIIARDYTESLALHLNELILAILACKYFIGMSCCILLNIVGSILVELSRRLHPRHQLLIFKAYKLLTCITTHDAIRHELLTLVVLRHILTISYVTLWSQISIQSAFSQDNSYLFSVIGIICLNSYVVDFRAYTESCI